VRRRNATSFTSERAREAALRRWHPPASVSARDPVHVPPERDDPGTPREEAHSAAGEEPFPRDDHAEALETLRELISPKMPAHVREKAARALASLSPPKPEPQLVSDGPRGVSLADVLELAGKTGVDTSRSDIVCRR
jgi:hypothetical protein